MLHEEQYEVYLVLCNYQTCKIEKQGQHIIKVLNVASESFLKGDNVA